MIAVNAKPTQKPPAKRSQVRRGRANLARLRRVTDREIRATSPPELANLPDDFWEAARIVEPAIKQPLSLRVDADVLDWFKTQGPQYQSRIKCADLLRPVELTNRSNPVSQIDGRVVAPSVCIHSTSRNRPTSVSRVVNAAHAASRISNSLA